MKKSQVLASLRALLVLTIVTGVVYPFLMSVLAQFLFPHNANGSLIVRNRAVIGSELIGQKFQSERYFWSRPSAIDYNPMPSGASNLGPTSKVLRDSVALRRSRFITANLLPPNTEVPCEMLFASGSGVDPHISPQAALLQVKRVAQARGFDSMKTTALRSLAERMVEQPQWGFLGQPRVNVLRLNLALDEMR